MNSSKTNELTRKMSRVGMSYPLVSLSSDKAIDTPFSKPQPVNFKKV